MPLTPQDTSRIAHLARLELSADEAPEMLRQLNDFFGIVAQMSAVDRSNSNAWNLSFQALKRFGPGTGPW